MMKANAVPSHPKQALMGERERERGRALSVLNLGDKEEWMGGQRYAPSRFTPGKDTRYPSCRGPNVSQCQSGWAGNSPLPHQNSNPGPSIP